MHALIRLGLSIGYGLILLYFILKNLFKEGKAAYYLFFSILVASLTELIRTFATMMENEIGILLIKISILFGYPIVVILLVLFLELLSFGKNYYYTQIPIYFLLGYSTLEVLKINVKFVGVGLARDFIYNLPLSLTIYYLIVGIYYLIYSTHLITKIGKKFGYGIKNRFYVLILTSSTAITLFIILLSSSLLGIFEIYELRDYFALIGTIIGMTQMSIVLFYPKAFTLVPIDIFAIQIFSRINLVEVYSKILTEPRVDVQLISQFIAAITNFSKEAIEGGYIKSIELERAYLIFAASKNFVSVAIASKYHYNIKVILENILIELENVLDAREELKRDIETGIIEVDKWKSLLDEIFGKEIFQI